MLFADVFSDGFVKVILVLGFWVWVIGRVLKGIDKDGQIGNTAREGLIKKINKWWN